MVKWTLLFAVSFLLGALLLLGSAQAAEEKESSLVDVAAPTAPHEVSAQLCGQCHQAIYEEWQGSMHAQSTALTDPIHGFMYRKVIGEPDKEGVTSKRGQYPVCLKCHAPNAAIQKKTKIDAKPAFNEGVNCIVCHTISGFKGVEGKDGKLRLGISAYEISKTSLQAPSGKNYSTSPEADEAASNHSMPFHPYPMTGENASLFKSSEMCLGCHAKRNNGHGIPVCATGDEIKESKSSVSCQSCHMPVVNGRASHAMLGGHDKTMVKRGVALQLAVDEKGGALQAKVTMENLLPHKYPTGAPFRNVYLQLSAFDDKGEEVWKNFTTHPLKDDKQAVLVYVLGDGEGKPTGAPKAKEVLSDSRLKPHEERVLEYEIPAKGVVRVRAELLYNLLLPGMLKDLKDLDEDLKAPKQAAFAEVLLGDSDKVQAAKSE